MHSFIGLGNPGNHFAQTKHNAGFWVIDELCRRWNTNLRPGKGEYVFAENTKEKIVLVKPTTGMNNSGLIIKSLVKKWNIKLENLYIIFDDVDLPLGKIRIKPSGGDGCHKGMESIIYRLGTNKFPRIRFGIASGKNLRPSEKYVLKNFSKKDQVIANESIVNTSDAVESIIHKGLNRTMNQFNA
tara:strand:- start:707 stop:1261 length:555 start_codon:yes stop_codon:yes gene_type:complete